MPQSPPNTPRTPSAEPSAQAKRGDELLTGVGHTVYEFQGNGPGAAGSRGADMGMSMGRPQRSNLSSGRGGVAIWIGVAVLLGAGALFWKINSGSAEPETTPSDNAAVAASTGGAEQAAGSSAAPAAPAADASNAQGETGSVDAAQAKKDAAAKAKAEQEAAAKKKAEQEAAAKKQAEQEAAAKKQAEQEAAAKKKAEQEAAAKKSAASKPKAKPKKAKKKKSGVKRIKPRPRKPSGLDGLPDPD